MDNNLNIIRDDALNKGIELGEDQFVLLGYIPKSTVKSVSAGYGGVTSITPKAQSINTVAIYIKKEPPS